MTEAGAERDQPRDSTDVKLKGGEVKRGKVGVVASWGEGRRQGRRTRATSGVWRGPVGLRDTDVAPRCTAHPRESTVHWLCLSLSETQKEPGASQALRRRSFQNICVRPSARGRPRAQPVHGAGDFMP